MIAFTDMAGFGPPGIAGAAAGYSADSPMCPLCLSHHDSIVTLECGHGFGKRCLRQRTDGNMIKCPTCFRLMDFNEQGIEPLHSDYFVNNILNIVSLSDDIHLDVPTESVSTHSLWAQKSPSNATVCQICRGVDVAVCNYCMSCNVSLCLPCTSTHQTSPSQHQLVPVPSESTTKTSTPRFCSKHQRETIDYCCNNCMQPVCRECAVVDHTGHNIGHLSESAAQFKSLIPNIITDLKKQGACINGVISQVDSILKGVEGRAKSVSTEVRNCIRANIKALEEKENELLTQIESIRKLKYELLRGQQDELQAVQTRLLNAVSLVYNASQTQHDVELVNIKQSLHKAINGIQADMTKLTMCHEDDHLEFVTRDSPATMKSSVSQLGTITSGISAVHTVANGHGAHCAIVSKYAKFTVTCRNHCNQKISQPMDILDVKLFAPDGSQLNVDVVIKADGVNQYSYFPSVVGTYTLSIQIRGRHIIKSPMKVKVRKRRNYFNIGASDHQLGCDGDREGQLCRPWGICCDPLGHIIVADRSNNRVQIFNPDGSFKLMFGETGNGPGQFNRPAGVTVNNNNDIVVADKDNHRIQVFSFDGTFLHCFGDRGSLNGQLHYPWDVACNADDCILVSDTRNHRIQLFSSSGQYLNKFNFHSPPHQRMQLPQPRGVCFTESGDILVTDFNKHRLMFLRYNLQSIQMIGSEGQGNGQFFRPQGVAVDLEGNILVSEGRNNRVQIFRPDGTFLSKFGSYGTGPSEFDRPSGVCVTPDGYIVVIDFGNNRIMFF